MSSFVRAEIFPEKISPAANTSAGNRGEHGREALRKFKSVFYEARTTLSIGKVRCQVRQRRRERGRASKTLKTLQGLKVEMYILMSLGLHRIKLTLKGKNTISETNIVLMTNIPLQKTHKSKNKQVPTESVNLKGRTCQRQ